MLRLLPTIPRQFLPILLILSAFLLGVLIPSHFVVAQERSSAICNEEICVVHMLDWADPRDPPPPGGSYQPQNITVRPGATMLWRNMGSDTHTATSGKTPLVGGVPDGFFDSQLVLAGETFSHQFREEGVFPYFCSIHAWMTGQVKVEGLAFEPSSEPVQPPDPEPEPPPQVEPFPEPPPPEPAPEPRLPEPQPEPMPPPIPELNKESQQPNAEPASPIIPPLEAPRNEGRELEEERPNTSLLMGVGIVVVFAIGAVFIIMRRSRT